MITCDFNKAKENLKRLLDLKTFKPINLFNN